MDNKKLSDLNPFVLTLLECTLFFAFIFGFGHGVISLFSLLWAIFLIIMGIRAKSTGRRVIRFVVAGLILAYLVYRHML